MSAPTERPVLLVDDHSLFAQSVRLALHTAGLAAHVVPLGTGAEILATCAGAAPATVLLDLRLGRDPDGVDLRGVELIGPLREAGCQVLVVTAETEDSAWGEALERGAHAVVAKDAELDDLVRAVIAVQAGERVLDEGRRQDLLAAARQARSAESARLIPFQRLSPREAEVLRRLAAGEPAAVIAVRAHVSEATVRSQIRAVLTKLQVTSQLQAVALARRSGWLDHSSGEPPA